MTMQVTIAELQNLLQTLQLPTDALLTITFENDYRVQSALKRQKALAAMKKLRGSGNGRLVTTLLAERAQDLSQ